MHYCRRMMSKPPPEASGQMPSFTGAGSMTYPQGDLRYIWDGRGTIGLTATCSITDAEIRIVPNSFIRRTVGWPELLIPVSEVSVVQRVLFGRYRFRSLNQRFDGACFRPIGNRRDFELAVERTGLPIETPPRLERWRWERRMTWNQMRWGGRARAPGRRRRLLP
jgi:hypothetical protein